MTLTGHNGSITSWEYSNDGGLNWTSISNTSNTYTYSNITQTTLVRAVIQIGSCQATSTMVLIAIIPPDIPPTINGPTEFDVCLGNSISVDATSSFGSGQYIQNGDFQTGQLNTQDPDGWLVDGSPGGYTASANNTQSNHWAGTNPKRFPRNGGIRYNSGDPKFAIATGGLTTVLETPVVNSFGLDDFSFGFDQAYNLVAGDQILIELSLDGGVNYDITLQDITGPAQSALFDTFAADNTLFDLNQYLGLANIRVRFTFMGTNAHSAWALDNFEFPDSPIDEVIQWTNEDGNVVTVGSTVSITPVTPGVQVYGVTSVVNGCRATGDEGTEFITSNVSFSYAGENIVPVVGECGESTVQLAAYDNTLTALQNYNNGVWNNNYVVPNISAGDTDYPGTGENGFWSITSAPTGCGGTASFSDINSPNSTFTGKNGTYTLSWTVAGCSSSIDVTINNCNSVDFDGINDYVDFGNNYALSGAFSIEIWVKPESVSGTQTLFSKRDANNLTSGYDLRLTNDILSFNWNSTGSIQSPHPIDTSRWHHVAVVFDSTNYRLYIDGIEVSTSNGNAPSSNNRKSIIGAMDQTGSPPNKPVNYFNGWLDEIRIWNKAITVAQIRQMMNQEITSSGTNVLGEVVPLIINGLLWSDLDGYYRMQINCGNLTAYAGTIDGKLRNITSAQDETAPLPYTSRVDNQEWSTDNTWTHFNVWDPPNSTGVNGSSIDWNIVRTSHDINSGNKDITVLGLLSDTVNKELTVANPNETLNENNTGQSLRITHYLRLDGDIDLVGESQLLQDEGSILDTNSSGKLERDQQGTTNLFNYNYWSSPVGVINTTANNVNYNVSQVLRDASNSANPIPVAWTTSYDASGSSNPITLSNRWLYVYENYPSDSYADWRYLGESGLISVGLGFTMKGSAVGDPVNDVQNYAFIGKPNNGTISTPITIGNQALVGNPYPSAIDANEFILDNIPGGNSGTSSSIDGTLYFWEHYTSNFTHTLEDYEGGYATYNLTGGNPAVSPPLVSGLGTPTKLPEQYVPVAQGFYVTSSNVGGNVTFTNDQRVFVRESSGNSEFIKTSHNKSNTSVIKRLRLQFITEDGTIRPLLLGFVSNGLATDGFDYGYDAINNDGILPNDMSWMIDGEKYTTQGVGEFDSNKMYPLGLFLSTSGSIEISLTEMENFNEDIDVYVYDSLLGTSFLLNSENYQTHLDPGNYLDRYYISFQPNVLSVEDVEIQNLVISYLNDTNTIYINSSDAIGIHQVQLINLLGQTIFTWSEISSPYANELRIKTKPIAHGSYIIKVKSDHGTVNKKVIIN